MVSKIQLLNNLKVKHGQLKTIYKVIQSKKQENEIIGNKWVLKDVLAHLSYYNTECVNVLKTKSVENKVFYHKSDDERNDEIYNETHNKSLKEIQENTEKIYNELVKEISKLSDPELANTFPGIKNNRTVSDFIAGESYGHYDDHIPLLKKKFNF